MNARKSSLIRRLSFTALTLLVAHSGATAEEKGTATSQSTTDKPILQMLETQGLKILGPIDVPGGLQGYAANAGTQPIGVYLTPDGEHAVIGTLVDVNGQDVAAGQLRSQAAASFPAENWKKIENANWIQDGNPNATRTVYVFTDPNCPYCNQFWKAARPWVESGKVQLRHILVGIIRSDSPNKAAAILEAKSPGEAMNYNEVHSKEGGIKPVDPISKEAAEKLNSNLDLMNELGFNGTPAIIFKDPQGGTQIRAGVPQGSDLQFVLGPK